MTSTANRKELSNDLGLLFRTAMQNERTTLWTALPGIVVSFDASKMTCKIQPTIQLHLSALDGTKKWVSLPVLVDCPVLYPGAGGFVLTFPIAAGDEVLMIFASRCIDSWWASGGVQSQAEFRMHDLSDGFVLPGPRSQPRVVQNINPNAIELRTENGGSYVSIAKNGTVTAHSESKLTATAVISATVQAPDIYLVGNVTVQGSLTASGFISGLDFKPTIGPSFLNHKHNIISGSNLGPPVPFP